jgi:5-methylcytosine-specific restriction enzyme A
MSSLSDIKPKSRPKVMDILGNELGFDVSDWVWAANQKYCYEYSFDAKTYIVINIYWARLNETQGTITWTLDKSEELKRNNSGLRKKRAEKFVLAIERAANKGLPIRVIVGDRKGDRVTARMLDPVSWAVVSYDAGTGDCVLERGASAVELEGTDDESKMYGFEGRKRAMFIIHRRREAWLRKAKIKEARQRNGGRLHCEVPGCGFEFFECYGEVGRNFAHVHHKKPLSLAPDKGRKVSLEELAVVCPNCHAMIHIGGECREMETLIPARSAPAERPAEESTLPTKP